MQISGVLVKELREKTGAGVMDCKVALVEAHGDLEQAIQILAKKGAVAAEKKSGRAAHQGSVISYIHGEGRVGVLVEVNCETDFVARTDRFREFAKDIAMHIAAFNPRTSDTAEGEDLMDQAFLKDPSKTVKEYLGESIAVIGENLVIRRFARYALGEF